MDYGEVKTISEKYMKDTHSIENIKIVFARQVNNHWKIVVRYETPDNPNTLSMLMIDKETNTVDYFREGITSF